MERDFFRDKRYLWHRLSLVKSVGDEGGGILSRLSWRIRPSETINIDSIRIINSKYLCLSRGSARRLLALMRVRLAAGEEEFTLDYSGTIRITLQQQRMKGLFDGLYKSKVPFVYVTMMVPMNLQENEETFEFDLVVGTWIDGKAKELEATLSSLEQRANVLAATLSVAMPNSTVRRLNRSDLRDFIQSLLIPGESRLPQVGDATTISTLETFEDRSPLVSKGDTSPQFYLPSSSESGRNGILLGNVGTLGGKFHEFRLEIEDLRRHVAVLGMTGSGKSTTVAVMVRQIAEVGLPLMVMDWHNEYREIILGKGGRVLSPSRDDFSVNPLEASSSVDLTEHVAMVTDIFADIYRFTHPQSFMFRNALQKCFGEAGEEEIPNLSSLVRTIEAYPLRSAYDNETKVALLRRIVPLTQGQAGKTLDRAATFTVDELLDKVLCVELGDIRDIQTRTILMDVLLKMVYEFRVSRRSGLEHVIVIEEARNVVPSRRDQDPPEVGERMISELRKFGEAMIFVAQFPTQVSSEVIKNSGVRIVHRVAWMEDLKLIGTALNLTPVQQNYVADLKVGEAVVSLTRLQRPILIQVNAEAVLATERRDLSSAEES